MCVFCNNLEGIRFLTDGKEFDGFWCNKKKFDNGIFLGYYSRANITKPKESTEGCDSFSDKYFPKKDK